MKVFLSSVFKGLEKVREAVHHELTNRGFTIWWAEKEIPRTITGENALRLCLEGIEACDAYLGIFPNRYGSYLDPWDLAFTEYEDHHAAANILPRFLYRLNTPKVDFDQQWRQSAFLTLLTDRDITLPRPKSVSSRPNLIVQILKDLEALYTDSPHALSHGGEAPVITKVREAANSYEACNLLQPPSYDEATDILHSHAQTSLASASVVGVSLIRSLLERPLPTAHSDLSALSRFFNEWHYVSAWTGVSGALSQTAFAKAQIVLRQMLRDYKGIYQLAGSVASGYYASHQIDRARKWSELSLRAGIYEPNLLGAISLAEGDTSSAKQHFKVIVSNTQPGTGNHDLHLALNGVCLVRERNILRGVADIEKALSAPNKSTTVQRMILEAYVSALYSISAFSDAEEQCTTAIEFARKHEFSGYVHQLSNVRIRNAKNRR